MINGMMFLFPFYESPDLNCINFYHVIKIILGAVNISTNNHKSFTSVVFYQRFTNHLCFLVLIN